MPDGRRIEVLSFGDPAGRPVIWMQSTYGFWRLPRAAEADLARRRLKVLVPFRAGWCGSDPLPKGRNPFEVAVADMRALMLQLRIASAVVVAPGDDIRIALMLAKADPARVRRDLRHRRRLSDPHRRPVPPPDPGRPLRARLRPLQPQGAAVHAPGPARHCRALRARALHARHAARIPADARAFADPEIAAAFLAGADKLTSPSSSPRPPSPPSSRSSTRTGREGLGHVACPVTLIHGEQDGNAPFETALDYCAMYPALALHRLPRRGRVRRPRPLARGARPDRGRPGPGARRPRRDALPPPA